MNLTKKQILKPVCKTTVCFLDETGVLNRPEDRFFGLGIIKTGRPEALYNPIQYLRDKSGFYDEVKWKNLSNKNYSIIMEILKIFIKNVEAKFAAVLLDKHHLDFQTYFANNFWKVYESFTVLLLRGNIGKNENLVVLADYYPSPKDNRFEQNIKRRVNRILGRKAVVTVCRLNSKTNDLLQLADLLLGAAAYELKLKHKLIDSPSKIKAKALEKIKRMLEIKDFTKSPRNRKVNVLLFEGNKKPQIMGHTTNT